ncbi:MAG: hypothetical protein JSW45_02815 [Thiotrichales bacterium]|nr:MAG: hypothetical protein JSW45_02815 [Thiotrichales bacterium]
MIQFRAGYSRSILLQLVLLSIILILIILINLEFVADIYFKNQATRVGYVVNSSILVLFALGLFRIISLLMRYSLEESALNRFLRNVEDEEARATDKISKNSLIARRYRSVVEISKHNVAVNHSALASTLIATESTRLSLPKFISNILILTGVFGTIVSLSVALLGASNIIDSADGLGNMGLVIHGMSTALSTTTTAIVCYLFFGYFYLKTVDVQTQLLSGIEQATTLYIMPRFTYQTDSMLHEVGNLVRALREAAEKMGRVEADFAEAGSHMNEMIGTYAESTDNLDGSIDEIKQLLRTGFRLPE